MTYLRGYFLQNNIPFSNAVANVAYNNGRVVALGSSLVNITAETRRIADPNPSMDEAQAIAIAERSLSLPYNNWPTSLEYVIKQDGSVALTYVVQVQNMLNWYEAFVDAHDGSLVSVTDFVAHARVSARMSHLIRRLLMLMLPFSTQLYPSIELPSRMVSRLSLTPRIFVPLPLDGTTTGRLELPTPRTSSAQFSLDDDDHYLLSSGETTS